MANIFLSYRRDGGEALAEILYIKLTELGYDVFYDKESLRSGKFEPKLYTEIERCSDFVLILPPGGLDRCLDNEDDWVRCEIRHAIACGKNIVPIIMRGFSFPDQQDLPEDIRSVSGFNGVPFENMEFIDARVERITQLMICQPLLRRKRRKAKRKGKRGEDPRKGRVATTVGKAVDYLRCHALTHIGVVLLLCVLMAHFGTETVRYAINSNVDQWVMPDFFAVGSPLLMGPGASEDNALFAKPMGDGLVTVWEVLPGGENTVVIDCRTEMGDQRLLPFFDKENRSLFLMSDTRMEVYNAHTGKFQYGYDFAKTKEDWSLHSAFVPERDDGFSRIAILWGEEDPESPTGYSLRACSFYDRGEEIRPAGEISVEGLTFIGSASSGYILLVDGNQDPCILDVKTASFVPSDQIRSVMREQLCGHLEGTNEAVDGTRRYFVHVVNKIGDYQGYSDIMIYDMEEGEYISSRTYAYPLHFSFSEEGRYTILYAKADYEAEKWVPEIRSVSYADSTAADEVLLNGEEIGKLFVTENLFEEPYFDIMQFSDSDTLLVLLNNRLQIIDMARKRRIASSNSFLRKEHEDTIRTVYSIEQNGCVYMNLWSEVEDPEGGEPQEGVTLLRFSFTEKDGKITVLEDAYDGMLPKLILSVLLFVLALAALAAFEIYGLLRTRREADRISRTYPVPEKKKVE